MECNNVAFPAFFGSALPRRGPRSERLYFFRPWRSGAMTFCVGISVDEGLVGIADTRVLSGNECLIARKTATYQGPGFSFFVMNSGLRSLRDKILLYFEEAFARETLARERLFKVVDLYARQVRRVSDE